MQSPHSLRNAGLRDLATHLVTPNMTSQDMALVAEIRVGTPPQKLLVLLDSGSSDMWIPSNNCKTCIDSGTGQKRYFDAYESKTVEIFKPATSSKSYLLNTIRYGSGAVQGVLVRDTIVFAGITIAHQSFLLTEFERMRVPDHAWDGIMGLAKGSGLAMDGPPIFPKLLDAGGNPIFTFAPDRTVSSQAELHVGDGGYSNFAAPGTLQWLDASSDTFWTVEAHVGVNHLVARKLLIDTGTSLLLMPHHGMVATVHSLAPPPLGDRCMIDTRLAMVFCACADIHRMRTLHIHLGNRRFSLEPEDLFERAHVTQVVTSPTSQRAASCCRSPHPSEVQLGSSVMFF